MNKYAAEQQFTPESIFVTADICRVAFQAYIISEVKERYGKMDSLDELKNFILIPFYTYIN